MLWPGKEDYAKNNCRAHHCRDYDIGADYDELCVCTTITIVIEHNDKDNDDREEADDDDHNALMLTIIMMMMMMETMLVVMIILGMTKACTVWQPGVVPVLRR